MEYKRIIAAIAMVALMLPALAFAQGPGGRKSGGKGGLGMPRGAWWQRQQVVKELGLSGKQQEKIETLTLAHRKEMIKLRSELQTKEVDLDPLLSASKLDDKKIMALMGEIETIRSRISRSRIDMLYGIRKVLTRDQYLKLKQLKGARQGKDRRGRAGSQRRPRGQGSRVGPGPHAMGPQGPGAER
jgi:Spy/CpxP family protein refolding chaperone